MSQKINTEELLYDDLEKKQEDKITNEEIYCDEDKIFEECEDDFGYQIKERGKYYYEAGHIISLYKLDNKYYAKVRGTEDYEVTVENSKYGIEYNCNCPYNYPCKHEYAVLKAISNKQYNSVKLKEKIDAKHSNMKELLELIPPEEIKEYIINNIQTNLIRIDDESFEEYFRKYIPSQDYEYYYNNLYNSLIINKDVEKTVLSYLKTVEQYINILNFKEGFKIIKSIIESYIDTNQFNYDENITDYIIKIGLFLRIIYRKCDLILKNEINIWKEKIVNNNYYNNLYLEDLILQL